MASAPKMMVLLGAGLVACASATGVTVDTSLPRTTINSDEYTATPNGWILSHCVYEVPNNSESRRDEVRKTCVRARAGARVTMLCWCVRTAEWWTHRIAARLRSRTPAPPRPPDAFRW